MSYWDSGPAVQAVEEDMRHEDVVPSQLQVHEVDRNLVPDEGQLIAVCPLPTGETGVLLPQADEVVFGLGAGRAVRVWFDDASGVLHVSTSTDGHEVVVCPTDYGVLGLSVAPKRSLRS